MNLSETSSNNTFLFDGNFNFNNNPGLVFVLISCACTGLWLFFLTFYLSRITGFILTKILQKRYLKNGYLSIGSFSMSLLSGKFMFRDIRYITKDFSIIVIDGQIIFKWWLTYDAENLNYYKKFSKDQDICDSTQSRLIFYLNGLEVHFFNRSDLYNEIQNILKCERYGDARKSITSLDVLESNIENRKNNQDSKLNIWRELFPLIRFNIRSGKLALGNRLLETTLWVHFNKGSAAYSMPDALSTLDYYTHFFQCKFDDLRVLLSKSSGYVGTASEPPRFMGQGFVVLQSGQAKVLYYQDEPGLVPDEAAPDSDPEWGLNVMFTKSANITYGPWVDKQRDALQKFFFPNNFQELAVTKPMESMQQRLHTGFDVKIEFVASTTLDLLFSKDKETSAVHICCSKPSSLHYYQPWVVNEYGYTSNFIALLQKVDVTTSLQFRKFLECDQIEIAINMMVPRIWNHFQHWSCEVGLSKTTCYFVSEHQKFYNDLVSDWSSNEPLDIAKFVPYDWAFNFNLRDFEIILMVNEHNWIECANQDENNELAICGETLEINFTIPNTSFLPEVIETNFIFRFETIMLRMFVPESNTLRKSVVSLAKVHDKSTNKIPNSKSFQSNEDFHDFDRNFDEVDGVCVEDQLSQGWRCRTRNAGWVDVWSSPVFLLNIDYKYHPIPIENDTIKNINLKCGLNSSKEKKPDELVPDILTVTLEGGPSAARIFGYFWKQFFVGFKDNYFGANQKLGEFNANKEYSDNCPSNLSKKHNNNQLDATNVMPVDACFHPLEVNVTVVLIDIHAELTMHTVNKTESPQAFTDRITFEIRKTYYETKMQLIIAPLVLIVPDSLKRHIDSAHLSTGFFRLSGFQFRGHAMFSDREIPIVSETIEYSWLTEIQCGNFTGKVTPSQLQSLTLWAETFVLHFIDAENRFRLQNKLNDSLADSTNVSLNSIEDLKYKMFRFSLESINVFLVETECACNILVAPVRFAVCNASGEQGCDGGSLFINEATLRFYLQQVNSEYSADKLSKSTSNNWVEVGIITLGAFTADIRELYESANQTYKQYHHLTFHDEKSKRIWFLWDSNELKSKLSVDRMKNKKCGCIGGCDFFGKNVNGVRFFTTQVLDATTDSTNHYGSGSLWGSQLTTGEKVKEYLRKLSGFVPKNILSSEDSSVEKLKRNSEIFSDPDGEIRRESAPFTFLNKLLNRSKGSKMNFKRSASVIASQPSLLRRFGSTEGSFYSCASESNIAGKIRSMKDVTLSPQSSNASIDSSSSQYASAVTSVQDLSVNLDELDYSTLLIKPICQPTLLAAYGSYLQSFTCINWPQKIPSDLQKNFNLLNNLKVIRPPGYHYSTPNLPHFRPNVQGNNIQGKLPFFIDQNSFLKDEEDKDTFKNSEITDKSKKRFINAKLHDQVVCILTPLVTKVVDRYISAFESSLFLCHPCHLLDHFHFGCISRSKDKYKESCILNTFSQYESSSLKAQIDKIAPPNISTVNFKLPYLNFLFFQISTESYTPFDTNSINGQCGSEYSLDVDVKNLDYVMLALSISNTNLALYQQLENPSLNNTVVNFFQKFTVAKHIDKHEILHKLETLIKPSSTVFDSYIGNAQFQLLHLKGNTDKVPRLTKIPHFKSNVNFSVKYDRSLCTHVNDDAVGEDIFGNIICEAGVEGIKIKFVNQEQINIKKFINNDLTSNINSEFLNAKKDINKENNELLLYNTSRSSLNSISDWQKVRKGYISLDIETGENLPEPLITFGESNTRLNQKVLFKQSSSCIENIHINNSCKIFGDMTLKHVWINLATPTHLKTVQKATDQDINLVTVLIPAISTWVPCIIDLIKTVQNADNSYKILNYSTLACLMSQSLPENGKLFKKHFCIISAVSEESSFLQSDYSSQLISVLRRHTTGQRLANLLQTLKKPSHCPGLKDLELGMQALSRQWKCIFIGAEDFENIFAVKNPNIRKPVVGRGVLTQKDLRLLLNEKKTGLNSVNPPNDQKGSTLQMEGEPLLDSDSEAEPENVKEKEQSLYDWMSRSPVSVRSFNKQKENVDNIKQLNLIKEKTIELEKLQSVSQMVSFPTSGVQLAEAADVFSALLSVVGLVAKKHLPSRLHKKFVFQTNKVSISLIESEIKKAKESTTTLEIFDSKFYISSDSMKNNMSSQYNHTFAVNVNDLKQHFDFPLVRLVLQISETCNVFLEQKKFAEKFIFQSNRDVFSTLPLEQQHEMYASKCWRNMYNVINLYIPKKSSSTMRENINPVRQDVIFVHDEKVSESSQKDLPLDNVTISGTFCLHNASCTASMSGLEFSLDMQQLNGSLYHSKKTKSVNESFSASPQNEASLNEDVTTLTVHMEETKICLLDSFFKKCAPNSPKLSRVLMTWKIYKTNGIYNEIKCENAKSKLKTLLNVGPIAVEIPQHPGTILFVSNHFNKKLHKYFTEFERYKMSIRESQHSSSDHNENNMKESLASSNTHSLFRFSTCSILVSATLLPSLKVEYKIEQINGFGNFNGKIKFALDLPQHFLSFKTKNQIVPLPASTHIFLPGISIDGHYIQISKNVSSDNSTYFNGHGYLSIGINIGPLELNLTTDLMNHLIFLQKGFIKEVNEIVQDVEENEPIPLWFSSYEEVLPQNPLIYSIQLKISLIRVMASIPSGTAVVLKTGVISVEFSNQNPSASVLHFPQENHFLKLYGNVQFTVDLSLGQFIKCINSDKQDFIVFASFKTSLNIVNTHDNKSVEKRKETIMVTLEHPCVLIKLPAVDKGVLVYLHFKNGFDQWKNQRKIISSDFPTVVEHLFIKKSQENFNLTMDLVLQTNIIGMGVCLPLQDFDVQQGESFLSGVNLKNEYGHSLVITIQEMSISCCSSGSFVSTGLFRRFCLQFNESFDHTAIQWIVNEQELMNTYCIPEGSYQLCSKTTSTNGTSGLPSKWSMTLFWKMCGIDIHVDSNIGKHLRLLTNALTTIVGESDVGDLSSVADADIEDNETDGLHNEDDIFNRSISLNREYSLDKQLWIQTNLVNNLRRENADNELIAREVKILQEIENALSVEFFKDVKMLFRQKSSRRDTFDSKNLSFQKVISNNQEPENSLKTSRVNFDSDSNSERKYFDRNNDMSENDLHNIAKIPPNSVGMDFELNIVVDIDSGKCSLHLSNPIKDDDVRVTENVSMVDILHKPPLVKADSFNVKFRSNQSPASVLSSHADESLVLLIPGVNARVHYLSSNFREAAFADGSDADSNCSSKKYANKIGSLSSVLSIQSLPKEMILRPSLLDFIEKALEPIMNDMQGFGDEIIPATISGSTISSSGSGLYSFPVNVVVIVRIDPSDIRFSCLPTSKVECLLRIPSLNFAITSSPPLCTVPYSSSPKKQSKFNKKISTSSFTSEEDSISNTFSCTACLSRFSFCIFHPYGKQYPVLTDSQSQNFTSDNSRPISGRKDSLSLNVEFIKFNLSRKRIKLHTDVKEFENRTAVKVSVICDIGSAAFNCDMRRTHEILDVPKAWYKHNLMRRMFLGKEGTYASSMTREGKLLSSANKTGNSIPNSFSKSRSNQLSINSPIKSVPRGHRRAKSAVFLENLIGSPFPSHRNTSSKSHNESSTLDSYKEKNEVKTRMLSNSSETCSEWETNLVLTFNVSHVDVSTNTGNVMGQVVWNTSDLRLNVGILVNNMGLKTNTAELLMRQSSFNTHGGVIGGSIEVQDINAIGKFSENIKDIVSHKASLIMKSAEIRLDYMGSCIIMTSLSLFKLKLDDEWPFKLIGSPDSGEIKMFVKCEVSWDELQVIMSRSTASDLTKLLTKLEEFFNQQHQSSVKLLYSLHKFDNSISQLRMSIGDAPEKDAKRALKYQHWIKLLMNFEEIPNKNVLIGGKLLIKGNFLSLACFHGSNFRSQNWALFTLREPCVEFTSETKVVEKSCQVYRGLCLQKGTFTLGKKNDAQLFERRQSMESLSDFMATVRRVSRGRRNPPSLGAPVHEWLVFINTVNAHDLPFSNKGKEISEKLTHVKLGSGLRKVSFAPKYRYENDSEVIFGLPQLSLLLITEHDQPTSCFNSNDPKEFGNTPHIVDTQLLSSFDDSISVTMDASLYFFLHDLILSYMKEKQSTGGSRLSRKLNVETAEDLIESRNSSIATECKYREFRSKGWKVEPRVRFLSWAGQQMDPVSIEWVLEKLGFMHAALTIPKWAQRGALDPLDLTLARLMEKLLAYTIKENIK
ncbi:bridge-like lipid transfer protein family member 1 isoform X3 [Hydra vulgaris]|uniref:Bridge-like lipid transfer protein family member 1 isoform X3 n=1 Tax=Hydra vulgaris TaxID=6087 RepID=A0ABM4D5Q1_HYDVU